MPRKTNINYMMRLVKKFIDDPEASRYVFEDMVYLELEKRYRLMASEDREYAEVFYDYIVENGTDAGDSRGLSSDSWTGSSVLWNLTLTTLLMPRSSMVMP